MGSISVAAATYSLLLLSVSLTPWYQSGSRSRPAADRAAKSSLGLAQLVVPDTLPGWCSPKGCRTASAPAAATDCRTSCRGDNTQAGGGPTRLALIQVRDPAASTPPERGTNAGVNGFGYAGCFTEGTSGRALTYGVGVDSIPAAQMTVEKCTAACKSRDLGIAGLEYSQECFCGKMISNGGQRVDDGCNMACRGNGSEYCGGSNRLSVYSSMDELRVASADMARPPSSTRARIPAGWTNEGCWVDGRMGRILDYQLPDNSALTHESCAQKCSTAGYIISATEYSSQCFCGNVIVNGGKQTADAECDAVCSGNAKQKCGGAGRMTIWSERKPVVYPPPVVQTSGIPGQWRYHGCVESIVDRQRTFAWQLIDDSMTPDKCLGRCAEYGYMAAGLEYGRECYCGDPANLGARRASIRPESECNIKCAGNPSAICGGLGRMTTYFWGGQGLYRWEFSQGEAQAGTFDFLIGGTTVPLITMESITGKLTFLSKAGTGPDNETGAYELDLSVLHDFDNAWRPLHLATDLFCAAGIVLPDKAGRQLTIGGWSGVSTYGVRLYWPDGRPGVWGKRNWQENADELRLQNGRWYPSVMLMANGSILVVGGEVGANGATVPTLELLPNVGPPLHLDWLERTSPNNLYPFLFVLPSGGIFVGHYNEARILDEKTFMTVKTLPNMPGAVNDDTAGRTYPLEGTAVLLPQRYPYTEKIGILICGGSTLGPGNALDNCITTYPEDSEPSWMIERMPAKRVMPCIAPLPDGTYLVVNGALHGVAGFGLATDPNYSAWIYDPGKPATRRFTVMANTTVARMYHSEAITLLDGRVLISGSDPEDGRYPQEYRVETFSPPYLLSRKPRPSFNITQRDWRYGRTAIAFTLAAAARNGPISATLLGAVASTHGNSMGNRVLMPNVRCTQTRCTVDAPPNPHVCPPGWYQFFVLDGGIPAVAVYVRIGGDPARLGNWPSGLSGFDLPGL